MIGLPVIRRAVLGRPASYRDVPARLGYLRAGRYGRLVGELSGDFAGQVLPGDPGCGRLPPRRLSFVGRAADLGEIAARLARYPVVTLTGVGGRKTALAVEAAWTKASAGRADLACYVDLVPCRGDQQVVAALVEAVGIRGAQAAAGLDAVAEAVSGRRSLLVIDNCEHVLEPARRACEQLAGRAAVLRSLATSRIPFDIGPNACGGYSRWLFPPGGTLRLRRRR